MLSKQFQKKKFGTTHYHPVILINFNNAEAGSDTVNT